MVRQRRNPILSAIKILTDVIDFLNSKCMHLNQNSYIHKEQKMRNSKKSTSLQRPFIVTIDGPAASGKTTVSRELARRLGFPWVSTGAFYRGLAYAATTLNCDLRDEKAVVDLVRSKRWSVQMGEEETDVLFDGRKVTSEIMHEKVAAAASQISQFPLVRQELLPLQRACWNSKKGLIAEGRDCGTVVFPDAELKIYLTARSEDRAQRRATQQGEDIDRIKADQSARDQRDTKRALAPLQVAEKSKVLDTSDLTLFAVVDKIEAWAKDLKK